MTVLSPQVLLPVEEGGELQAAAEEAAAEALGAQPAARAARARAAGRRHHPPAAEPGSVTQPFCSNACIYFRLGFFLTIFSRDFVHAYSFSPCFRMKCCLSALLYSPRNQHAQFYFHSLSTKEFYVLGCYDE